MWVTPLALAFAAALVHQSGYRYYEVADLGVTLRMMDVMVMGVSATAAAKILVSGVRPHAPSRLWSVLAWVIGLYLVVGLIAVARGYAQVGTWAIGVGRYSLLELLWVPALVILLDSETKVRGFVRYTVFLSTLAWLVYFAAHVGSWPGLIAGYESARFLDAATTLGLVSITIIVLAVESDREHRTWTRGHFPLWTVTAVNILMIVLIQHRSAWVGLVVGLVVVLVAGATRRSQASIVRQFGIALVAVVTIVVFDRFVTGGQFLANLVERRLIFINDLTGDANGLWRIRGWLVVIGETMSEGPILGLGFSRTGWLDFQGAQSAIEVWEHNQYVHFFRAAGFLGVSIYMAMLGLAFAYGWRLARGTRGVLWSVAVGGTAIVALSAAYMMFYNQNTFVWIGIGLIMAVGRIQGPDRAGHRRSLTASKSQRISLE